LATHKSAEKRARQSLRRKAVNQRSASQVRSWERKIRKAVVNKDKKLAESLLSGFMKVADRAAKKRIIRTEHASRRISRLSQAISKLG